jgi:hypothetical protein
MTDTDEDGKLIDHARRRALILGSALITACVSGQASLASGDGGGGLDFHIEYDDSEEEDDGKPLVRYSQVRFGGLSQKAINSLYYKYESKKITFRLDGFSDSFAPRVLRMGYNNRGMTRNLLRDMRRIKTEEPRRDRLKYELDYSAGQISDLKVSVRYLRSTGSADLEKENLRLKHGRGYRAEVRYWHRRPLEGTF